ncbi:MAG: molybdate ABC transporter substrate-binding protein [Paracoccus denitrificans]|nr:MAG: molybdate ABC transporter substrate-binding protein [Paracoccus denitrificans]PZO83046.1 MAG: molybdate ABC transporter substrate-binding protein [Paracoccus denitrificans]
MSKVYLVRGLLAGAAMLVALPSWAEDVTVFAAASLKTALDEIVTDYNAKGGDKVVVSYAGSSKLAKQIQEGAPADIFISAATDWMDTLDKDGLLADGTRTDLLGNTLVLVGSGAETSDAVITTSTDIAGMLKGGKLAMAMVDSVPAGVYGKQALTTLGQWDKLSPSVAQADDVRAALMLVSTGEAPLGIVYGSDARADDKVGVVGTFPAESHDPIVYPAAIIRQSADKAAAKDFFAALKTPAASESFVKQGFTVLGK